MFVFNNFKKICLKSKSVGNKHSLQTTKPATYYLLPVTCHLLLAIFYLLSCSFDYYEFEPTEEVLPDLVMENVEYVRVKSAEPQARFQADRAERYEKQNLMMVENISFEQFGRNTEEVNAAGLIGNAVIETDSGNIIMDNGVRIEVESEDIVIETAVIEWQDESRTLFTGEKDEVIISMSNGGNFNGTGFFADIRRHTWEFKGNVEGEYFFEDDEEDEENKDNQNGDNNETE